VIYFSQRKPHEWSKSYAVPYSRIQCGDPIATIYAYDPRFSSRVLQI